MSKSDVYKNELLLLILNNVDIAGIGDAGGIRGSVAAGSLYVALHTADPTDAGNQASSECAYTGYARVAVARTPAGWTVTGNTGTNAGAVTFPACTGGTSNATHFSVGDDSAGAGKIRYHGALTTPLAISNGITPQFGAGELAITED